MARLLLGVTGGIAAYKAVELARLATRAGHSVRVLQTPTSVQFVGRASFEGITALLGMLASCAAGITVVGIDNGFGAACAVARMLP